MKNLKHPEPDTFVIFTDIHGVERKGMYKADVNAFVEISEVEMPLETKLMYKMSEVGYWKYEIESAPDLTKFVL